MVLIVCVDDRNGMMFHKRRQSQDRILRKRILERAGRQRIWMSQDTAKQFEGEKQAVIRTDEHFFQKAGPGEFCFVEDPAFIEGDETIEKIICYRWNRTYPGDAYFPIKLASWKRIAWETFAGYSHEKITEEIYIR